MKSISKQSLVKHLRIGFWYGVVLDAIAAIQMAFPGISAQLMGSDGIVVTPEYRMAMWFAASLMTAWTVLLAWAAMKPIERHAIVPFTMIIIAGNVGVMIYAQQVGLMPLEMILPQIILAGIAFCYYGVMAHLTWRYLKENERQKPHLYDWQAGT